MEFSICLSTGDTREPPKQGAGLGFCYLIPTPYPHGNDGDAGSSIHWL